MPEHEHTTQRAWDTPCDHAIFQAVTSTFNLTHFSNFKLTHLS
ncbi:hypothetical protein ACWGY7_18190 [Xanthomonas axonopodis pv. khayae]